MNTERRKRGKPSEADKSPPYRSFILRCWQERGTAPEGGPVWRFSLLEVGSEQPRRAFPHLAALFAFLEERTSGNEASDGGGAATSEPPPDSPHLLADGNSMEEGSHDGERSIA